MKHLNISNIWPALTGTNWKYWKDWSRHKSRLVIPEHTSSNACTRVIWLTFCLNRLPDKRNFIYSRSYSVQYCAPIWSRVWDRIRHSDFWVDFMLRTANMLAQFIDRALEISSHFILSLHSFFIISTHSMTKTIASRNSALWYSLQILQVKFLLVKIGKALEF